MGKVNVEVSDVVEDVREYLKKVLEAHDTGNCPIDIDDCDAVGEHIKEQGWTAYDLSIDLEDFAEQDQLAAAVNVGAVVNEHGIKDVIESCIDHEGIGDVLNEVMNHAESSEAVHAMVSRWDSGSVFASVLARVDLNEDDVFEELLNRDADILKALGQKNVMKTLEALGWLPADPAPAPADRPTWEEVVAFVRGFKEAKKEE